MHDAQVRSLVSPYHWQARVSYWYAEQAVHDAHVAEWMLPSVWQRCVPVPARARMHGWLLCDGAWWRESLWCGCGGTVLGRGLVWRLDHGAWGHE